MFDGRVVVICRDWAGGFGMCKPKVHRFIYIFRGPYVGPGLGFADVT